MMDSQGISRYPKESFMDAHSREEFQELLSHTSRSFSLGIMGLENPLQDEVCLGYLICRIFDTYEDTVDISPDLRRLCLEHSAEILENLDHSDRLESLLAVWDDLHRFEELWPDGKLDQWEKKLLQAGARVWREIANCSPETRQAFQSSLRDMILGMIVEVDRRQMKKDRLPRSLPETDEYCYAVAGTVGCLLTKLFRGQRALPVGTEIDREGIEFGKALQLVNILKDFHKDWKEGRCYWPDLELPVTKLSPRPSSEILEGIFESLRAQFDRYLVSARSYVHRIDPTRKDLRFFCEFPLKMAEATLAKAASDMSWLREGGTFKVSRLEVAQILGSVLSQS